MNFHSWDKVNVGATIWDFQCITIGLIVFEEQVSFLNIETEEKR